MATFVPKAYTNGKRTEIANSAIEEANLLWAGWWVVGSYTPPPSPQFVTEGELAPVAKSGAYSDLTGKPTIPTPAALAADPALRAAYAAPLPTVGSLTYNGDGTIASDPDGNTYTWNTDGTPATQTKGGTTRTFHWNTDGTLASVS